MQENYERFWVTQAGLIIKDGKCLIMELVTHPGKWDIPGGRIDVGEADSSEEAFRREIKEETGIEKFDIIDLVSYDTWSVDNTKFGPRAICCLMFLIDNPNTYDIKLSHEHTDYKWVTEDEIEDHFLWPGAQKMLKAGFKKYNELKK